MSTSSDNKTNAGDGAGIGREQRPPEDPRVRNLLHAGESEIPSPLKVSVLAVLALQQYQHRTALGKGNASVQRDLATGRAGGGESGGHEAPEDGASEPDPPIPNPLGPRTTSLTATRRVRAGGDDSEDADVPDLVEDTVVAAMLVTAAANMFDGILDSIRGAHSLVDAAVLLTRAFFFTDDRAWQAKDFTQWTRKDFNPLSSLPLPEAPVAELVHWSKVAFDVYFLNEDESEGHVPARTDGTSYTRDDTPTRERFQIALQRALAASSSTKPPALDTKRMWEFRRVDSVSGRLDQAFTMYLHNSAASEEFAGEGGGETLVVAIPGTSNLGDWVTTLSDRDLHEGTLATLGWGMEDAVPGLRGRSDLRVHHEYQTLAHEVFDNITDALKKAEDGGGAALTAVDQVVIVGHSKGAGVGQLLAAMLLGAPCLPPQRQSAADCGAVPAFRASHESATFHVSLRAFAPPRVATVQVQELMRISQGPGDSLVGVVNATDVVPRLSRHTIAELIQSAMTPYPSLGDAPTEVRNIAERVQRNVSQIPTLDVMCDVAFIHPDGRHLLALRDAHKFLSHVVFTDKVVHDHRASSHVRALERLLGTGGGRIETVGAYRVKTGGAAAVGLLRHFCRACCCCADSGSTGTTVAPAEASK